MRGMTAHGDANGGANGAAGGAYGEDGEEGATDGDVAAASTNTINGYRSPQRIKAYNAAGNAASTVATTVTTLARVDARVDAPVNPLHLHFHDSILRRHQIHAMCDFTRLWQGEKRERGGRGGA